MFFVIEVMSKCPFSGHISQEEGEIGLGDGTGGNVLWIFKLLFDIKTVDQNLLGKRPQAESNIFCYMSISGNFLLWYDDSQPWLLKANKP